MPPLQDVVAAAEMEPPHAAGFVRVAEAEFGRLAPTAQQSLAVFALDSSSIAVHRVLRFRISGPVAATAVGFRDLAAHLALVPP